MEYRSDIQILRGLAVTSVVLYHAKQSFFPLGYLGVDVFFVISGFVITPQIVKVIAQRGPRGYLVNLKEFYIRRFFRLAPAFSTVILFCAIAIFILGPSADHGPFAKQGIAATLMVGNFSAYLSIGNYFSANPNPIIHTWSLSVEQQIYLILPITLLPFVLKSRNHQRSIKKLYLVLTMSSLSLFVFPDFLLTLHKLDRNYDAFELSFYSTLSRAWQFLLGGIVYFFLKRFRPPMKNTKRDGLIVLSIIVLLFGPLGLEQHRASIVVSAILCMAIRFSSFEYIPTTLARVLLWLGLRSYSLYLVHMPLIYIAKFSPLTSLGQREDRMIETILAVIASLILGSISFSKIENRFRRQDTRTELSLNNFAIVLTMIVSSMLILLVMIAGSNTSYWGLDKNIPKPAYAGGLDLDCKRDSLFGPPCIYGEEVGRRQVLLIGDSHAGDISQAVVDAARSMNWSAVVWTQSGCYVQFESTPGHISEHCKDRNAKIRKWIRNNRPTAIIVAQYIKIDSAFLELRETLIELKSTTPNVILVSNKPIFPDGDFLAKESIVLLTRTPRKVFAISEMDNQNQLASDSLSEWAKSQGIRILNFKEKFCNETTCFRYLNSNWLYRDADHFSIEGASLTKDLIIESLDDISAK